MDSANESSELLPPLRSDLGVFKGPSQQDGSPSWNIFDPVSNKYYRIGWLEYSLLKCWGQITAEQLRQRIRNVAGLSVSIERIQETVQFIVKHHLHCQRDINTVKRLYQENLSRKQHAWRQWLHRYFFFRIPLIRPDKFLGKSLPYVKPLFRSRTFLVFAGIGIVGFYLTFRQWGQFQATIVDTLSEHQYLWFFVLLALTKVVHEFGHAYTARYYSCHVPTMGVAFMIFWPVLYTDTTDAWKLSSRKARLHIGAAGVIAECAIAVLATFLWPFFPQGPVQTGLILLAGVSWLSTLLINLNPFMRFDGYYLLSDALDIPNLQSRAFALTRWHLRESIFGFGDPVPEPFSADMRRKLIGYGYLTWLYRLVLYIGIALLVYQWFFKLAGILLFVLEMAILVVRPVAAEMRCWINRKASMTWNKRSLTALVALFALITLIIVPWKSYIESPAISVFKNSADLYAPVSGQVVKFNTTEGAWVEKGELMIVMRSPALEHQIEQLNRKLDVVLWQLDHAGSQTGNLAKLPVLESELSTLLEEKQGLENLQRKLTILAPFSGRVGKVAYGLTPGAWVKENLLLINMMDPHSILVEAYLDEVQVAQASKTAPARFYADALGMPVLNLALLESDISHSERLMRPALADVNGGDIRTKQSMEGSLEPISTLYRWQFEISDPDIDLPNEIAGTVRLEAERESFIEKAYRSAIHIIVRESGF